MGFTTGFTGGVTLTLGLAYLTVLSHERNRQAQALYLRSQSQLLNSLIDPTPLPPPSRAELARQSRSTFTEIAKDRWNHEIENAVSWVQTTDWNGVREGMESAAARLFGQGLQKPREGIEEAENKISLKVQEAVEKSRAATVTGIERGAKTVEGIIEEASATKDGLKDYRMRAGNTASNAVSDAESGIEDIARSARGGLDRGVEKFDGVAEKVRSVVPELSAGTVDTARGAVRNVISKGIEKGKEVIGKAQEAVGLATEKVESASKSTGFSVSLSPIEKALRERYEKPHGLEKTAKQVLEERYVPMDQRDNTVLRGV